MNEGLLLAFDYGTKRIGIAVGQTVTQSARPLITVAAKNGVPEWNAIHKIIKTWRPDALIVGIPLNMDGTEQPITQAAKQFTHELHERFHLPTFEVDERLTTKDAREQLFAKGGFRALQNGQVDRVAAQLILETWFTQQEKK